MASQSLTKAFLSIKGIYYQVVILGVPITWVQPYKFTQKLPFDVDYKIMMNFCEFYEALLKFVNFKLYKDAGLEYPPPALNSLNLSSTTVFSLIQPFIHKTQTKLKEKWAAANPDQRLEVNKNLEQLQPFRFFLNRETPIYSLEFILLSAGCQVGFPGDESPFDESAEGVTHQVVDRPVIDDMKSNREYVQPQWVYDCLNHGIILPTAQYAPGKALPAHLSPFVDNRREGYVPTRQKEINQLKGVEEEMLEEEEISEDEEMEPVQEEEKKVVTEKAVDEELTDEEDEEKDKAKRLKIKKQIAKENKELGKLLMTKKARRLYERAQKGERVKHQQAKKLETKRKAVEKRAKASDSQAFYHDIY
eukprot:TRINITY_DN87986_c0_g1_i1.p1 TRINITY_DN87986_c0_g1~~TRINITY_DN87986_c0_g1_i1.p1  ORF type:complete len:362 (-),score=59.77 TRINITY_DN87986_c0_g1_i1:67-1152(-)